MESLVLTSLNQVRQQAGLPPFQLRADISNISRDWSNQMIAANGIPHRPQNQLSAMLPPGWLAWGENVARATTLDAAVEGLINSPGHYQNMVNPAYNVVGIGVAIAPNGLVYLTQNFVGY